MFPHNFLVYFLIIYVH